MFVLGIQSLQSFVIQAKNIFLNSRWRYGGFGSPFSSRASITNFRFNAYESWGPIWTQTGVVPGKLSQVDRSSPV